MADPPRTTVGLQAEARRWTGAGIPSPDEHALPRPHRRRHAPVEGPDTAAYEIRTARGARVSVAGYEDAVTACARIIAAGDRVQRVTSDGSDMTAFVRSDPLLTGDAPDDQPAN